MAIDSSGLQSPSMSERDIEAVETFLQRRSAVDLATGEIQWEFTSGQLKGSYDHAIRISVEREKWVNPSPTLRRITEGVSRHGDKRLASNNAYKVPCEPFLRVEGSIHKALLGHNVYGGPLCFSAACDWLIYVISERVGVSLPDASKWEVYLVDWAEVFDLGTFEAVQEYIKGLNLAEYPRRNNADGHYGSLSLHIPGRTTTLKTYHKGPEFYKHDSRRLRNHLNESQLIELQERANRILRVETSIKSRKLVDDFGEKPLSHRVTREYLEGVHDREVLRLLKEADLDMQVVRTHTGVSRRLQEVYPGSLGNLLFGTWLQLAAVGEQEVRRRVPRRTFYRQRKQLMEAGCSWLATDIKVLETSAIPPGFSPVRSDCRRLTAQAEEVQLQLFGFNPKDF